jgi:integrase
MDKQITPQEQALAHIQSQAKSMVSHDVAIRKPLGDVVTATLNASAKSQHTRRSYETGIALFVHWLDRECGHIANLGMPFVEKITGDVVVPVIENTGKSKAEYIYGNVPAGVLLLVDASLIDSFLSWRSELGDTQSTREQRKAIIKVFLSVALRDNILTQAQATQMGLKPYKARVARDNKTTGRRLSVLEVQQLRQSVDTSIAKGKRDILILDLGLFLGLRESEIADLRMVDFQNEKGRLHAIILGKGNKTRKLPVHQQVYDDLIAWCEVAGLTWYDDKPLLYSVDRWGNISDRKISPTDVARTVCHYGAKSGIATRKGRGRLGAHDLRRTMARRSFDRGASLPQVQKTLGHANIETTMTYIGYEQGNGKNAVDYVSY